MEAMKRVLVVDDEESIRTLLTFNLEKEGFVVEGVGDGQVALEKGLTGKYDFIILDLMLPGLSGTKVCKELRQAHVTTPIMMLTAKDEELDKIIGLELGADDYMTKPFSPRELLARINAIFRRYDYMEEDEERESTHRQSDQDTVSKQKMVQEGALIICGDVKIHTEEAWVKVRGQEVSVTRKEFELLTYLAKRATRTVKRENLVKAIWNYDYSGESRMIDAHIRNLREKIEKDPKHPEYILTVRGFGYMLAIVNSR